MSNNTKTMQWEREAAYSDRGTRLDRFWAAALADEGVSRGKVKTWIEAGMASVDGDVVDKGKYKLAVGQKLTFRMPERRGQDCAEAVPGELTVLFEDEHVVVVDKRAGVTTHPAPGEPDSTLVNHLLHRYQDMASETSGMDGQRPGIVHRLDKDTSGLIVAARTEADRLALADDFACRRVSKVYLALVHGVPEKTSDTIEAPIGRHATNKTRMAVVPKGGREARSDYKVIWSSSRREASLVAVRIHTGRTHQIRVHMAHIGHPLLGDGVYGSREKNEWERREDRLAPLAPRQMLHAFHLSFTHPATGERLTFFQEPPEDFQRLFAALERRALRLGIVGMPGSGKSALLGILRGMHLPCFSADACVGELYAADGDGAAMVRQRYGGMYSRSDGSVDKPALFAAMCESEAVRREVMEMVHPMVQHCCEMFFKENRDEPVAYAEVPLLLEGGWHTDGRVDGVAGVHCPAEKRTGELRKLRGLPLETLAMFDSWQWPEQDKLNACDFIVDNSGGLEELASEAGRLRQWAENQFEERNQKFEAWLAGLWPQLAETFAQESDNQ